jgi:hypothetical protein
LGPSRAEISFAPSLSFILFAPPIDSGPSCILLTHLGSGAHYLSALSIRL